jgi:hypothetical protein
MSSIRELSLSEIELVSGGNANGQSNDERNNFGRSDRVNGNRGISYGAQANGFQANYAAAGGTGSCGPGTVAGLVGGFAAATVATGGLAAGVGFVGSLAAGMIGGQCFPSGSSSSSSKNGPPFR